MLKIKSLFIILISLFFLVGCWDRREISDINFVMGMGIDLTDEGKYRVTFQWALPQQFSTEGTGGSSSKENTVYSIEADSVPLALSKLTEVSTRMPVYSHMELIVIGDELAKSEIKGLSHFVDRMFEMRRTIYIVKSGAKAEDILRAKTPFETVTAAGVQYIVSRTNRSSTYREVNLNHFFKRESDPDAIAFMPIVETVSDKKLKPTDSKQSWVRVNKVAFFEDYSLVGELSPNETRAWLYVLGEISPRTVLQIQTDGGKVLKNTLSQKGKTTINMNGQKPSVTFTIEEEIAILEKPDTMDHSKISKSIESFINDEITKTFKKYQEENLDIFSLRTKIRQQYPEEWKQIKDNWKEVYANMDVKVNAHVNIQHENSLRKDSQE